MRIIIYFIFVVFCGEQAFAQFNTAKVDERFELTSIVCRLAEAPEYSQCRIPEYAKDIDTYFTAFRQHPLIDYMKRLRRESGVSYDAVSSMAHAIEIRKGKIVLRNQYELSNLSDSVDLYCIDPRWTKASLTRYLTLLNDFYRKSRFRNFFRRQETLYSRAEERMNRVLQGLDSGWFESFFGEPWVTPSIYVSIANGPSNYALFDQTDHTRFGILIGCTADSKDEPDFSSESASTILHEISHRYCNPLASDCAERMASSAKRIAPSVASLLSTGAYDTTAIIPEWFTRLAVLMYLREHFPERMSFRIAQDQRIGFIWQRRAVEFMDHFYENRKLYPYFRDFLPQIIRFFAFTAEEFDRVLFEFENRHPYVVSIYPLNYTQAETTKKVVEFEVKFSQPMATYCEGYKLIGQLDKLNREDIPTGWKMAGWKDDRTYVFYLNPEWIEKADIRGFILKKDFMQSKTGNFLIRDFEFKFK